MWARPKPTDWFEKRWRSPKPLDMFHSAVWHCRSNSRGLSWSRCLWRRTRFRETRSWLGTSGWRNGCRGRSSNYPWAVRRFTRGEFQAQRAIRNRIVDLNKCVGIQDLQNFPDTTSKDKNSVVTGWSKPPSADALYDDRNEQVRVKLSPGVDYVLSGIAGVWMQLTMFHTWESIDIRPLHNYL